MPGAPRSTWIKMAVAGVAMCVGGPALIYYVSPTEEELFLRYNPELQRRSLAARAERQEDFDAFVTRLKAYSKSDKPIWAEWEKDGLRKQEAGIAAQAAERRVAADKAEQMRAEVRAAAAREGR